MEPPHIGRSDTPRYGQAWPHFEYGRLDNPGEQIRLLRIISGNDHAGESQGEDIAWNNLPPEYIGGSIRGELSDWYIDEAPPYTAISYVWGSGQALYQILIGRRVLSVRRNAHSTILKVDRHMKGTYLWIDSVCINQLDNDEKKDQVRMMGKIFNTAEAVVSSVGNHSEESRMLFGALRANAGSDGISILLGNLGVEAALVSFSQRRYWTRLWIIQECIAARQLYVLCGNDMVPSADLETMVLDGTGGINERIAKSPQQTNLWEIFLSRRRSDFKFSFEDTIQKFGRWDCKDLRDHIYGLLYLIEWTKDGMTPLAPDYSLSVQELAMKAFRHCSTVTGVQAVCDSLALSPSGGGEIAQTAFQYCASFDDAQFLKQILGIRTIDDPETATMLISASRTLAEKINVCQWALEGFGVKFRLELLRDSVPLWSSFSSVVHLLRELSKALDSESSKLDTEHTLIFGPEFYKETGFEERAGIFLGALPCMGCDGDVDSLMRNLDLPGINLELAQRILASCSQQQIEQPPLSERGFLGKSRRIEISSCLGDMLGLLLHNIVDDVEIDDRIRLAYASVTRDSGVGDVARVLRSMRIDTAYSPHKALVSALRNIVVCLRRVLVLLCGLKVDIAFDPLSIDIQPSVRTTLWVENELHTLRPQLTIEERQLYTQRWRQRNAIPDAVEEYQCLSLCSVICLPSYQSQSLHAFNMSEYSRSNVERDWILGYVGGFWLVTRLASDSFVGPEGTHKIVAIAKFANGAAFRHSLSEPGSKLSSARLHMSATDLHTLVDALQETRRDMREQFRRPLSGNSWLSLGTAAFGTSEGWEEDRRFYREASLDIQQSVVDDLLSYGVGNVCSCDWQSFDFI